MYDEEEYSKKCIEALRKVDTKAKTTLSEKTLVGEEREGSMACRLASKLFREAIDSYEDGSMEWPEMVDDLHKTLKVIKPQDYS